MLADGATDGLDSSLTPGESSVTSSGVTVHVVITPRDSAPALGATGADTPVELVLLGIALTISGIALVLRRAVAWRRTGAPDMPG